MSDRLKSWRHRSAFTLVEAALLITENYPEEWVDKIKLFEKPPVGFNAIYGQLLIDAVSIKEENVESIDYPGQYYTDFMLNTDNPKSRKKIDQNDGLNISVDRWELLRYVKAKGISAKFFTDEALARFAKDDGEQSLGDRERNCLYRIIGALLYTFESKDGQEVPLFKTQSALIKSLTKEFSGYEGVSKSNLEKVFPEAKRLIDEPE